jgi:threonine/homoserine/homoserine lactone efflux protein
MGNFDFSLVSIFGFSFLVALTGAMAPGPLLTYTIIKSVNAPRRGYLMGAWIILGHAVIEMGIILLLLSGCSFIFYNVVFMRVVAVAGGLILLCFGVSVVINVYRDKIPTGFLSAPKNNNDKEPRSINQGFESPVLGGAMVSMSNPYWWIWWTTIGFAFMIQFDVSLNNWPKLIAFFVGHEAGDLIWYLLISCFAFFGVRFLNKKIYYAILFICGIFMIVFGIYLGTSLFFKPDIA